MIVKYRAYKDDELTPDQIKAIERAKTLAPVFDEDSPALTPAMEKGLRVSAAQRNRLMKQALNELS